MSQARPPLRLLCVSDGRRGHDTQSLGLATALARRVPTRIRRVAARGWGENCRSLFGGGGWRETGVADLIIGAGHGTHLSLLGASRALGCPAVVLMSPSLPLFLFDLCVIPHHDNAPARRNIVRTLGALNTIEPLPGRKGREGLILIGGPSAHYGWDETRLLEQLQTIAAHTDRLWHLTDSPRTPATTSRRLREWAKACRRPGGLRYRHWEQTERAWLTERMRQAGEIWVSRDSMSMICESLSAGAATGLLEAPERRGGKLRHTTAKLIERGGLTPFRCWRRGRPLPAPARPLREADRVAAEILRRFFPSLSLAPEQAPCDP